MSGSENTVMISTPVSFVGNRRRNFYITTFFLGFLTMIFHFTVVFFFTFQLKSLALVGIFLGLGNLVAFFIDIPIGILQKYFMAKVLYGVASFTQLIAMGIFALFIFNVTDYIATADTNVEVLDGLLSFFLGDILNIALLILAAVCYGLSKELVDVTTLSYMMNHADPSQYGEIIARNNIYSGVGMFLGLLLSGVILSASPKSIIFVTILFIGMGIYFYSRFFDSEDETIRLSDIKELKVSFKVQDLQYVKDYVVKTIQTQDLKTIVDNTKYIFLKPREMKSKIDFGELFKETKITFLTVMKILSARPINITVYWTVIVVLTFGFWDTFASTFLIGFLDRILSGWSYVLLGIIALPAFGLQEIFGKIGGKYGVLPVALIGMVLSGGSLLAMGLFSSSGPIIVMICALLNSSGYAAGMALGQMSFLDVYNREYARIMKLKEIDSNASAGPMKILQNLANVFGLMLGGFILGILDYKGFFLVFGGLIIWMFVWTSKNKNEVKL